MYVITSIIFIALMISSYITDPPVQCNPPMNKDIGNIEGNIYIFGFLAAVESLLFIILIIKTHVIKPGMRIIIVLFLIPLVFIAHIITMEAGGVEAAHAMLATVFFVLTVFLFFFVPVLKK